MKKLIVLSVIFALVAGGLFAADVSGTVFTLVTPFYGSNAKGDDDVHTKGGLARVRVEASGENEDGTAGGYVRLDRAPWWGGASLYGDDITDDMNVSGNSLVDADGYVWWKPLDQFKLLIGGNGGDGFFGMDGVARWGFYQVGGDVGFYKEGWAFGSSFYQGFGSGVVLTATPIDALEINIGLPLFHADWENANAKDVFPYMHVQVAYNIDGVGKVGLTYTGAKNELALDVSDPTDIGFSSDAAKIFLFFNLSSIENIGLDVGIGYTLPVSEEVGPVKVTYSAPIAVGVGFTLNADPITLKARVQGRFGEKAEFDVGGTKVDGKGPTLIDFDILPSFAINDNTAVVLDAGLAVMLPDEGDSVTSWHVQPAITVKTGWWAPSFYAGFRLDSDGVKGSSGDGDASKVNWSVPIGLALSF